MCDNCMLVSYVRLYKINTENSTICNRTSYMRLLNKFIFELLNWFIHLIGIFDMQIDFYPVCVGMPDHHPFQL